MAAGKLSTKIALSIIISILIIIPLYMSLLGMVFWITDEARFKQCLNNPPYLYEMIKYLLNYWWVYRTNPQFPPDFSIKLFSLPLMSLFVSIILTYSMRAPLLDFRPMKKKETVHGDAHWASEAEIKAAKLRSKKGLLLGRTGHNNYLIADDFQHVLLFAPTGSGKGVGFVLPNLVFWQGSLICHDIKGENHDLTSGYREKVLKQKVFLWNPAD
ncbi:MAG: type IV secretory system conjugative DNA transfer family protein, partial [Pseudomonadota bacterium]